MKCVNLYSDAVPRRRSRAQLCRGQAVPDTLLALCAAISSAGPPLDSPRTDYRTKITAQRSPHEVKRNVARAWSERGAGRVSTSARAQGAACAARPGGRGEGAGQGAARVARPRRFSHC